MIILLQRMGFRIGDRAATKKKKPEYGNIAKAIGNGQWNVKLDSGLAVEFKSQSIIRQRRRLP